MNDMDKLDALLDRGNGSIAFFRRDGQVHAVIKYLGGVKKPPTEYVGQGRTLVECVRNTYETKTAETPKALPGITHQEPKVQFQQLPGLTTR